MAPHSSTLAWKIPWTEEPGGLQSMGSLESDTTEWLHFHFSLSCIGEGNGNPLQCSCLENLRDGGAWWAAVYGVIQSQTRLKRLSNLVNTSIKTMRKLFWCGNWSYSYRLWTEYKVWSYLKYIHRDFPVAQTVKNLPARQETWVSSLDWEVPLEKGMAIHSSILAWRIPWTEKPGGLQSMGSQRVGHHWATSLSLFPFMHWRRKWQPTPVFLPEESQGWGSLVGRCLWGRTESDTTEVT